MKPLKSRDIKYLRKEDIDLLIEIADKPRDKLIIKMLFATFMRSDEFRKIQVRDIEKTELGLAIKVPMENTKTKEFRKVVITDNNLVNEILAHVKREKQILTITNRNYLFKSRQSGIVSNRRLQQIIRELAEKAGIQYIYGYGRDKKRLHHITPHTFRHSGIIYALNLGIPQTVVMEQSGHKSLRAFQVYSKYSVEDRAKMFKERQFII